MLPSRLRQLDGHARGEAAPTVGQLMELNREVSGLDQERTAGRFTLTKYILYLLPVIGFIGTVEGISPALRNIGPVLKQVNDLDGFLNNLGSVTWALQIAFDSTLLALFLSAALMFVQTLIYRLAEDHLARVDAWVVEHVLPRLGRPESPAEVLTPHLERLREDLIAALTERLGAGFGPSVDRFATAVDRLPASIEELRRGAEVIGKIGDDLGGVGEANETARRVLASLSRIEAGLAATPNGRGAARADPPRPRPRDGGRRGAGRAVDLGLRALQPLDPGAARPDPGEPEGGARPAARQHGAGQRPLPEHRPQDVRRADRRRRRFVAGRLIDRTDWSDRRERSKQG